jgi:hypothetical protein
VVQGLGTLGRCRANRGNGYRLHPASAVGIGWHFVVAELSPQARPPECFRRNPAGLPRGRMPHSPRYSFVSYSPATLTPIDSYRNHGFFNHLVLLVRFLPYFKNSLKFQVGHYVITLHLRLRDQRSLLAISRPKMIPHPDIITGLFGAA